MNNYYKNFFLNKIELFSHLETTIFILLLIFILALCYSFFIFIKQNFSNNKEIKKLVNFEKNLIHIKELYNNGQINAQDYRERVINLKNKFNIL